MLLFLLSCSGVAYQPTVIDSLRVVATVLQRPELSEGEAGTVTVYVANPDALEVDVAMWTCLPDEADGCVEAALSGQPSDWLSVSTLSGGEARFSRRVPEELDEVFEVLGSPFELPLYVLACERDACPIMDKLRQAISSGGTDAAFVASLRSPETWLQDVDPLRSSLSVRSVRLTLPDGSNRNENPEFEPRFTESTDEVFEAPANSVVDLSFLTSDPNFETVYLYSFTTLGRFAERRVEAVDSVGRTWLEMPREAGEGQIWVVFDDRDGGNAVYTQQVRATP